MERYLWSYCREPLIAGGPAPVDASTVQPYTYGSGNPSQDRGRKMRRVRGSGLLMNEPKKAQQAKQDLKNGNAGLCAAEEGGNLMRPHS